MFSALNRPAFDNVLIKIHRIEAAAFRWIRQKKSVYSMWIGVFVADSKTIQLQSSTKNKKNRFSPLTIDLQMITLDNRNDNLLPIMDLDPA